MAEKNELPFKDRLFFNLHVNYAKRALLGGGKGQFIMAQLKAEDKELHDRIMRVARQELKEETGRKAV